MAFVTDEQSGIEEWTHIIILVLDEGVSHDTGFVATDGGNILLTDDTCLVITHRGHSYIRTVVVLQRKEAIG